jgi:hypothetical protein
MTVLRLKMGYFEDFSKKVIRKFGRKEKCLYLCTRLTGTTEFPIVSKCKQTIFEELRN